MIKMIAIIDYGMGNIHSVQKALESLGAATAVTNSPKDIEESEKVVLPGVGAFGDAAAELEKRGLISSLNKHISGKKIFLGICLGMQLLFEESQESGSNKGLGALKGKVKRFDFSGEADTDKKKLKVPHMGWNELKIKLKDCPLFRDLDESSYVYFCHSYYVEPADKNIVAAATYYGREFVSIIWQDNVYGVQFHPEKSQDAGMRILNNFVKL